MGVKTQELTSQSKQWPQVLAAFSAVLTSVCVGINYGWISSAYTELLNGDMHFEVTNDEIYYVNMVQPLGYLVGCPLSGFLADRIGRKASSLLIAIPQIGTWILIIIATNIETLYLGKFIAGIADGAYFVLLPMYIGEISEPCIRGALAGTLQLGAIIGLFLINAYGSYTSILVSAYISMSIPILFLATFIWMPESPYYYLIKGETEKAKKSLQFLRRMENVDEELNQLSADVQRQMSESGTFKDIFVIESNRKAFLIMLCLRFFQQFTGLSAINAFTQIIFKSSGGDFSPAVSSMLFFLSQFTISVIVSFLIDKLGRRFLFIFSSCGVTLCLMIIGAYFYARHLSMDVSAISWLPITGLSLYITIHTLGLGICPNVMTGELFSASIKPKTLTIITLSFAIILSANAKVFQYLDQSFGMHAPFFFYASMSMIAIVFGVKYLPETRGKTLEEIQQNLKGTQEKIALK